ncbi:MAG: tRNA lysidine(34) synthetase TilS [Mediterranea sp.]|jgi:tRNA(Ile)-lysidine synthase|nr:tRNA lysidine(34) synthetase TilS [Mediterranea sp.]
MGTEQKTIEYIRQEKLFTADSRVLVALSGGADSVALLRILHASGYYCEAAHCNFHLRGWESDRDERFVEQLCQHLGIELHTIDFDTEKYASERQISIEMAARELRYDWFEQLREALRMDVIAVAHHQDDNIETMLLNLIRGTGIAGLTGIRPHNGHIVRPLLCINREQILHYLESIGQGYVTDSTNLEDEYTRNRIRHQLIPLLQEFNPSIKEGLQETSKHLKSVNTLYNKYIEEARARLMRPEGILIEALLQEEEPKALLFEILHPLRFTSTQIAKLFESLRGQPGKQFKNKEWRVVKDRKFVLIDRYVKEEEAPAMPPYRLEREEKEYTPDFEIPREKAVACFDANKLDGSISFRRWHIGDKFVPFGMKGQKKVSDYLTNRKFSLLQKENQWVMLCGEQIAWLIGERTDNRFRIDEKTQRIVIYTIISD